jgi:hypothetical protein
MAFLKRDRPSRSAIVDGFVVAGVIVSVSLSALNCAEQRAHAQTGHDRILRVRGLIIEDAQGHDRVLLGAPVTSAQRKRTDPMVGLLIVDEHGVDRVSVGAPIPAPQEDGAVQARISGGAGFGFNDAAGNERGGLGVLDNGRAVLGLDREDGEGTMLYVMPHGGPAGLRINGDKGRQQIAITSEPAAHRNTLAMSAPAGGERLRLQAGDQDSQLVVTDGSGKGSRDVLKQR